MFLWSYRGKIFQRERIHEISLCVLTRPGNINHHRYSSWASWSPHMESGIRVWAFIKTGVCEIRIWNWRWVLSPRTFSITSGRNCNPFHGWEDTVSCSQQSSPKQHLHGRRSGFGRPRHQSGVGSCFNLPPRWLRSPALLRKLGALRLCSLVQDPSGYLAPFFIRSFLVVQG